MTPDDGTRVRANVDQAVAEGFGREWTTFRQGEDDLPAAQRQAIFDGYFAVFPWDRLPQDGGVGLDVGCGSGRWAAVVAPRVSHLHLIDASRTALDVARANLASAANVSFHLASVDDMPLPNGSQDFAISLGVLHHVPDTRAAIAAIARKLKPGAPFLVYLYYAFDNRPAWFRAIWSASDAIRRVVSHMPAGSQRLIAQLMAAGVYWPLARAARLAELAGLNAAAWPLAWYRGKSFYVMRTDAYDRFCTRLERRFTRAEIEAMLNAAGFEEITFSEHEPYWCAAAIKSQERV